MYIAMSKFSKILTFLKPRLSWKYILVSLVILGVSGYGIKQYAFPSTDGLETSEIKRGEVEEVYVLTGSVKADEYAQLTYPTSGKIAWVGVLVGNEVKKGQYLAKLDTTTLNSTFETAKSALRVAEAELQKVHDDFKNHASDETYTKKDARTTA